MGKASRMKRERKQFEETVFQQGLRLLKEAGKKQKEWTDSHDDWTALDQAYFAENPDQKSYTRSLTSGERIITAIIPHVIKEVKITKYADGRINKMYIEE